MTASQPARMDLPGQVVLVLGRRRTGRIPARRLSGDGRSRYPARLGGRDVDRRDQRGADRREPASSALREAVGILAPRDRTDPFRHWAAAARLEPDAGRTDDHRRRHRGILPAQSGLVARADGPPRRRSRVVLPDRAAARHPCIADRSRAAERGPPAPDRQRGQCVLGHDALFRFPRYATGARAHHGSGALPPAFPAIRIDGEPYWDGGVYSNTPVEVVLDDNPRRSSIIFSVQMWNPAGPGPRASGRCRSGRRTSSTRAAPTATSRASSKFTGCAT